MADDRATHDHAFFWVGGRYACECGVWCYDLPPIPPYPPESSAPATNGHGQ